MAKASGNTKKAAVGAGILAATAAGVAAGYYFYASKDAEKNRRIAAKWATDMKNEVVREAKKVKNIDRAAMLAIIDQAAGAFNSARNLDRKELARAAKELKSNWRELVGEMGTSGKRTVKKAKKTAKKTVAKVKRAK